MLHKPPVIIDWAITSRCNLRCRHCRGMTEGDLATQRALGLIDEIAALKPGWVIIEGGEPLLRDDLFTLLGLLQQRQIAAFLITNGMLLTPEKISALGSLGSRLMISIDGDNARTYEAIRSGASFSRVISQVHNCARAGILEAINFAITQANFREIPGIFEIAGSNGVRQVNLIGFKPCHSLVNDVLTPDQYLEAINLACTASQKSGVGFFFDEPFFWAVVKDRGLDAQLPASNAGIVSSSTSACIFVDYLFIEPNGDVKPCSFAPMVVGNAKDNSLEAIWRDMLDSPSIQQIKDPKNRKGPCGECSYVTQCKGCRSRTFALTGDWLASDPCCPLSQMSLQATQEDTVCGH